METEFAFLILVENTIIYSHSRIYPQKVEGSITVSGFKKIPKMFHIHEKSQPGEFLVLHIYVLAGQ